MTDHHYNHGKLKPGPTVKVRYERAGKLPPRAIWSEQDDITPHCRPDYLPWEQRVTCRKCAAPLADNPLVGDALRMSNINAWAMQQLTVLADMADDRGIAWVATEARRVADGLMLLDAENKDPVARQPPCGHSHDFPEYTLAAGFVAGVEEEGSE